MPVSGLKFSAGSAGVGVGVGVAVGVAVGAGAAEEVPDAPQPASRAAASSTAANFCSFFISSTIYIAKRRGRPHRPPRRVADCYQPTLLEVWTKFSALSTSTTVR